jgi:hypothetical protein
MAGNSFQSMLSLLQMWMKNQDAAEKRQHDIEMLQRQQQPQQLQQAQQSQGGQQQQQSSPMDAYNQYNSITDMLAASPAYEVPAMGSTPAATSAFGGAGELGGTAGLGAEAGSGAGAGAGGMATAAAPYAALAAALGAFKLNDDWMSKGAGKTFGGEMQSAWDESFGNHGMWGLIKKLF